MLSPARKFFCHANQLTLLIMVLTVANSTSFTRHAFAAPPQNQAKWEIKNIPQVWKKPPAGIDGYSWYRCLVTVPKAWEGRQLELFVEAVDDARQVFFNGIKIGSLGEFPPAYRSGLGMSQRFVINKKLVRTNQPNVISIRIYQYEGRKGFNVAAPVIFGGKQAIRLQGAWQYRAGDDLAWAKGKDLTTPPENILYAKLESADKVNLTLKKLSGEEGPLSLAESLKRFQIADDLELELAVGEPHVRQPLSMKFDERGLN